MNSQNKRIESGYRAWLRYEPIMEPELRRRMEPLLRMGTVTDTGLCLESAVAEWAMALAAMTGESVLQVPTSDAGIRWEVDTSLPGEAFTSAANDGCLVIQGGSDRGLLYGTFRVLQHLCLGRDPMKTLPHGCPAIPLRMLNHWDNLVSDPVHGSIERVRGGDTIFDWTDLASPNPRYKDYARMLASVGLNGICVNNVNADPEILAPEMIEGLASLAKIFQRWGVRLFVSVNFGSPVFLGGLSTADPLDAAVVEWWRKKADELYAKIPDFGGWLVKADSEGKPGPGTYGRSHIEGSACLARALAPHGGTLFWRAFVYGRDLSDKVPHERAAADRANHASYEFRDWDGMFDSNVLLQVKCSAVDFQTWEPPHALFGLVERTRLCVEFALTKEYSGNDIHAGWEGPYFHNILNFEASGHGSPIGDLVGRGELPGAITAVANVNNSRNWFGHLLHGATLFSYARLGWEPAAEPRALLDEWAELTFGSEAAGTVAEILDGSYDAVAAYTMPMGLTYISEFLHHFEPDPWENHSSAGITPDGIGTDRTVETGSGYAGLYPPAFAALVGNAESCPERWLLYFHHLPWTHKMADGQTLIQRLYDSYADGVERVQAWQSQWRLLRDIIDDGRWAHVMEKLALQVQHAERWRDLVCRFLREISGVPDCHGRFEPRSPSPHNRVRSGYRKAFEDYRARVARETKQIAAAEK